MDMKKRCQSCGMPLMEGGYGTNTDGTLSTEYCKFCFKNGSFIEPDLTVNGMVARSINFMSKKLSYSEEEASRLSNEIIPKLKRWAA